MARHLHIVNTRHMVEEDYVSTFDTTSQPEAGSACSQFLEELPPTKAHPKTVTSWQRIKRAVRAWWVSRTYKP